LAHRLEGPEDAPVLVLSGSLGTTTALWEPQLVAFAGHYRVLRHDQPGHGASPVPAERFTIADIGRAVLALLDDLEVDRASLCGLSMGGMIGMWIAANAPARIEGLVLSCTGPSLWNPESWAERAAVVRRRGTAAVATASRERWFTPAFRESQIADRYVDDLRTIPAEGYARCCEAIGEADFHDDLEAIAAPTLVIGGADDPVATPKVAETLRAGIPDARSVLLRPAAHLANVEQPLAFSTAVLGHLEERVAA
jgi:3-oxoadipate enol-lactonase